MKLAHYVFVLGILALVTGCATQGGAESEPAPVEERTTQAEESESTAAEGAAAEGATADGDIAGSELDDPDSPLSERVVLFDFDSNAIRSEYNDVLAAHGDYLAAHPEVRLTVEGHTDERGSQEYNLALGERRADAVKRVLVLNGASADQVESVSYGEERPAMQGSGEDVWSQNRRAVLVYQR